MYPEQTAAVPKAPWELPPQLAIEAPRGPEVRGQLERLSTALANLEDTTAHLRSRLDFVLTPDAPAPCAAQAGKPANARSDMASVIDHLEQRVSGVAQALNNIMYRLEV